MPLLAIDTSAAISTAIVFDDDTAIERNLLEFRLHSEQLNVVIADLLAEAKLNPGDLTDVAVGTGPGPFTGLRIGIAAARTMAFALDTPLYGVCSLDALANQATESLNLAAGTNILVATDARRREVYWATYQVPPTGDACTPPGLHQAGLISTSGPAVAKPTELSVPNQPSVIVGQGAVLYPDALPLTANSPTLPSAATLGRIANARANSGVAQPTEPRYLRRPDIHGVPSG